MNKEGQEHFKNLIQLFSYGKNIFRFCFFGQENIIGTPLLLSKQNISIFKDPEGKIQTKKRHFRFIYDPPTRNIRFDYENQILFTGIVDSRDESLFLQLYLYDELHIYGLGAINGNYNRNRGTFILRNIDTFFYSIKNQPYASFPFLFFRKKNSNQHFAILSYTSYPIKIHIQTNLKLPYKHEIRYSYHYKRETPIVDFILLTGNSEEIIKNYIKIIGFPYFPPIWSIGYHQSRWSYKTQAKVEEIAATARKHNLPLDAIYLDIHYMNKYKVFTWNPKRFPQPRKMSDYLKRLGIRLVSIIDPGIAVDSAYSPYKEGLVQQLFCKNSKNQPYTGKVWPGKVHFPDFTKEKTRNWWAQLHKYLFDKGIEGIWNDMNEPVLKIGKKEEPLKENIFHERGSHLKIRNIYANLEAEATFLGFQQLKPNQRPFIVSRSGSTGLHKWSALWTGDNHTSWEHLRENLYMVINLNLCGMFFCGADIGGFGSPRKGLGSLFKFFRKPELFERWVELGSLLPFFRNHTTLFSYNQEPWNFSSLTFYRVKKHIRRRYQLLLYIYYLFFLAHTEGIPIIRPIFYSYGHLPIDDEQLKNQFFLGDSLLSCPVLYPDIKTLQVFLPPGDWYEYETGKLFTGNKWLQIPITKGYYPLFVKGGSVIPVTFPQRNAEETLSSEIFLEIYPDNSIEGFLYLDDGISNQYQNYFFLARIYGERQKNGDIRIQYEIISDSFQPKQKNLKIRLPKSYQYSILNIGKKKKKKNQAIQRELFNEDRKYSVCEFEFPIYENWEAKFTMDK